MSYLYEIFDLFFGFFLVAKPNTNKSAYAITLFCLLLLLAPLFSIVHNTSHILLIDTSYYHHAIRLRMCHAMYVMMCVRDMCYVIRSHSFLCCIFV